MLKNMIFQHILYVRAINNCYLCGEILGSNNKRVQLFIVCHSTTSQLQVPSRAL